MSVPNDNPYLSARAEWNERYGDFVKAAHTWKMVAFAALGTSACAVIGS